MSIEAENITVGYDSKNILSNESIEIEDEKINIIIGKNGCGKSTLLKTLCRQLLPKEGRVLLNGLNVNSITRKGFAQMVGILFQENNIPHELTVKELVSYGRFAQIGVFSELNENDDRKIKEAMQMTNTLQFAEREVNSLSSGQRQLVWIAMLIAQEAQYIFLDEPTTYLDMSNQFEILKCLSKLNQENHKTIVMILHDINIAMQFADKMFIMKDGHIEKQGTVKEIAEDEDLLKNVFGVNIKIIKENNSYYCIPMK